MSFDEGSPLLMCSCYSWNMRASGSKINCHLGLVVTLRHWKENCLSQKLSETISLENEAYPYYIKESIVSIENEKQHSHCNNMRKYFVEREQLQTSNLLLSCSLSSISSQVQKGKPEADSKGRGHLIPQPLTNVSVVVQYGFNVLFFALYWIPSCFKNMIFKIQLISLSCRNIVLITIASILSDWCSCFS